MNTAGYVPGVLRCRGLHRDGEPHPHVSRVPDRRAHLDRHGGRRQRSVFHHVPHVRGEVVVQGRRARPPGVGYRRREYEGVTPSPPRLGVTAARQRLAAVARSAPFERGVGCRGTWHPVRTSLASSRPTTSAGSIPTNWTRTSPGESALRSPSGRLRRSSSSDGTAGSRLPHWRTRFPTAPPRVASTSCSSSSSQPTCSTSPP